MGTIIGNPIDDATQHLGVPYPIPVGQGGPDAFVGMLGLGCIRDGQLCLTTGSSHLQYKVTNNPSTSSKIWGAYRGAPISTTNFAEGGQSSTGSIVQWIHEKIFQTQFTYKQLDEQATNIAPGCDGLVALELFQGSRTPITDPLAKGAFIGLTLF
jgi:ribulose kinase